MPRLLICCLFFGLFSSLSAQTHDDRLRQLDVLHYRFMLVLSDSSGAIVGDADLALRFLQPAEAFTLDLVSADRDRGGMQVSAISTGDAKLRYEQSGEQLKIWTSRLVKAGDSLSVRIRYAGIPADGLIIGANKFGQRTFFGDNWPNRAHHWLPCVDHPADKASVEFIVVAPNHYQVVGNGVQLEETNLPNDLKLTHWRETAPLPTKVMVIGVAPFAVQLVGEVGDIPITSWVFPGNRTEGFGDYAVAKTVLNWFIEQVGPYPYGKLANVQSKTRYGGMENASNIFYFENSVNGRNEQEDLIAHEIAHQWFGNSASEANWHHIWLSEGFATYCTDLYLESRYGREFAAERLAGERQTVIAYNRSDARPIVDTTVRDLNDLLNPNSYQKGAWVLHMLRQAVGDSIFRQGLRAYYDQYKFGNALTEDFQRVMERVSGQNLTPFFQQWLYRPGLPRLGLDWRYEEKNQQLVLQLRQLQSSPFTFPLDIQVTNAAGESLVEKTVNVDQKQHEWRWPLAGKPAKVILDPKVRLLFAEE